MSTCSKVFVDGSVGTTGLEISELLTAREDLELLTLDSDFRKDPSFRRDFYEQADVVILCLPDDAAREAVTLTNETRFIDASTAHRTDDDWAYGLAELTGDQRSAIANARFVSNPGCYPTGFLLMVRPLVDAGLISSVKALQVHAVSGYSGGGKKMIEKYEDDFAILDDTRLYSLGLNHKHLPEMQRYACLKRAPFFLPSVGPFYRGMTVSIALPDIHIEEIKAVWRKRYNDELFINVVEEVDDAVLEDGFLSAMRCNHTNRVDLLATSNGSYTLICAVLDNLGKGASQAAIQNLNLMLGIEESTGLTVN